LLSPPNQQEVFLEAKPRDLPSLEIKPNSSSRNPRASLVSISKFKATRINNPQQTFLEGLAQLLKDPRLKVFLGQLSSLLSKLKINQVCLELTSHLSSKRVCLGISKTSSSKTRQEDSLVRVSKTRKILQVYLAKLPPSQHRRAAVFLQISKTLKAFLVQSLLNHLLRRLVSEQLLSHLKV
jgi:hypothetical protein